MALLAGLAVASGGACGGDGDGNGNGDDPRPGADAMIPDITYEDPLTPLDSLSAGISDGISGIEEVHATADGRVAFCTSRAGVSVVDSSDPASLSEIARVDTGPCQHVALSGDVLFVAHRGDGVEPQSRITAWDLTQSPAALLDTFTRANTSFEGIVADGSMLYAAAHDSGVFAVELQAGSFSERGSLTTGFRNAWGVALDGTLLYVADAGGGVAVIDVANPDALTRRGATPDGVFDGSPMSLDVHSDASGTTVYVGAGHGGIAIIDASNPAQPTVLDTANTPGSALQVSFSDGHLHVADWTDARVFDVSESDNAVLVTTESLPELLPSGVLAPQVRALAAVGSHVFVGEWSGLHSFELHPDRAAPDIRAASRELAFFNVSTGGSKAVALVVHNDGSARLVVLADVEGDRFTTDVASLDLGPGESGVIEVRYTASGSVDTGTLVLRSGDPDQARYEVPLTGNGPKLQVGEPAPEIAVAMVDGGEWRTSQQLGQIQVLSYFSVF